MQTCELRVSENVSEHVGGTPTGVESVESAVDFNAIIDAYLKRERRPKQIGRYFPSEIASCLRRVWFTYLAPKEMEPEVRRILETGNLLHDFVAQILCNDRTGQIELLQSEVPFNLDLGDFVVSGRIDDLLLLRLKGREVLLEVKSCKDLSVVKAPKWRHLMQLNFYMYGTGVKSGMLLYVEKNTLQTKTFPVTFNEGMALKALERLRALDRFLKERTPPPPEAALNVSFRWACKYCDYVRECNELQKPF